jgi:hypothetical protein
MAAPKTVPVPGQSPQEYILVDPDDEEESIPSGLLALLHQQPGQAAPSSVEEEEDVPALFDIPPEQSTEPPWMPSWIPKEEKTQAPLPSPSTAFTWQTLPPRINSVDSAISFLTKLFTQYPVLDETVSAVKKSLQYLSETNKAKLKSADLPNITNGLIQLRTLISKADTIFSDNKENILKALNLLLRNLLSDIESIPQDLKNKAYNLYYHSLAGQLRTPRERTSKYSTQEDLYIHNRAIKILSEYDFKTESKQNAWENAQQIAEKEWNDIIQATSEITSQRPDVDQKNIITLISQQIINGSSIDDAKNFAINYIDISNPKHESVFKEIEIPNIDASEEEDIKKLNTQFKYLADTVTGIMGDKSSIMEDSEMEIIPEDLRSTISDLMVDFSEKAQPFLVAAGAGGRKKKLSAISDPDVKQALLNLYQELISIGQKILNNNPEYLKSIQLFEDVYVILKIAEKVILDLGLDVATTYEEMTSAEKIVKRKQPKTKDDEKALGKLRIRDPEVAHRARTQYEERSGQARLEDIRERAAERARSPLSKEQKIISHNDSYKNKGELNAWINLALRKDTSDLKNQLFVLTKRHADRTIDIFKEAKASWLSSEQVSKIIEDLYKTRVKVFGNLIEELKLRISRREYVNPTVLDELKKHFDNLRNVFQDAMKQVQREPVIPRKAPEGIKEHGKIDLEELNITDTSPMDIYSQIPKELRKTKFMPRASDVLDFAEIFLKYANII